MRRIPYPHPGEILDQEFLAPLNITRYRLSKAIGVPQTAIGEIINGTRSITTETGLLLSRYFGTSDEFWIKLQVDYDAANARDRIAPRLAKIVPFTEMHV
ncbi:HigA family addiction module antitoxin [Lysobacter sp. A6]|uniref:HigA family addiction module antitoxin n=1 Tax=Noviluteimonas lactosilytica TaxID=2888523 RepID=A0ABS8JIX1_9GAMM|nr:HigA family addiction module antitoxin [Lysobacter lactosilyticus]MCC8363552.1 HigA family addiction module antitoxin [Lysobacter lactosilyticus]